jgi:hypothetical protein
MGGDDDEYGYRKAEESEVDDLETPVTSTDDG